MRVYMRGWMGLIYSRNPVRWDIRFSRKCPVQKSPHQFCVFLVPPQYSRGSTKVPCAAAK